MFDQWLDISKRYKQAYLNNYLYVMTDQISVRLKNVPWKLHIEWNE